MLVWAAVRECRTVALSVSRIPLPASGVTPVPHVSLALFAFVEPLAMNQPDRRYHVVDFDRIPEVGCPCGTSRRAFAEVPEAPGTVHRTEITEDAKPHYHRRMTETYYILDCGPDAKMQLDGELVPIRPGMCVLIPAGVVHRAVGRMTILIIVYPKFDPADEVLVDE